MEDVEVIVSVVVEKPDVSGKDVCRGEGDDRAGEGSVKDARGLCVADGGDAGLVGADDVEGAVVVDVGKVPGGDVAAGGMGADDRVWGFVKPARSVSAEPVEARAVGCGGIECGPDKVEVSVLVDVEKLCGLLVGRGEEVGPHRRDVDRVDKTDRLSRGLSHRPQQPAGGCHDDFRDRVTVEIADPPVGHAWDGVCRVWREKHRVAPRVAHDTCWPHG